MSNNPGQPSECQILEALEKSGYLFEQDVATKFESMDFHVETNYAYTDLDQDKSREIDVRAVKNIFHDESTQLQVFVECLVECKDFGSPIVFLERIKNSREKNYSAPQEYVFPKERYSEELENGYIEHHALQYFDLGKYHYYFNQENKATQFSKIYRKGSDWFANHEGIYDSLILPQAKLLEFRRREVVSKRHHGKGWKTIWLFFPMVVLRDHLYVYDFSSANKELRETSKVSFIRHFESKNLKGSYLTDFVTYKNISNFLGKEVNIFTNAVVDIVKKQANEVRGDNNT